MEKLYCKTCGSEDIIKYDKVKRLIKSNNGSKEWIDINRYKCNNCNSVHRHLPNNITPFKHYDNRIIQGVMKGWINSDMIDYEDYPSEQTMKRWILEE